MSRPHNQRGQDIHEEERSAAVLARQGGEFQILPNPTDDPSVAASTPSRREQTDREVSAIISSDKIRACPEGSRERRPVNITPTGLRQETVPLHPISDQQACRSRGRHNGCRAPASSAVRFTVLCYGKTPTQTSRLCRRGKGIMLRHIPQEAFERFSKAKPGLYDIRETDEYTQEVLPGSRLIRSIIAKHLPSERRLLGQAHCLLCHSANRTANASICWSASPATCRAYRLDGGISGWRRRGFRGAYSSTIPLFARFRSRPVPGCSSASSAAPSGIRFLAVRLCRRRVRRHEFRVLRPRRAAFAHAVEPALNRLYGK